MAKLVPYLNFNGNTLEAFQFYQTVFGGAFSALMFYKDIPGGNKMTAEDKEKIMHISLPVGNDSMLMATDSLLSPNQKLNFGDNFHIAVQVESYEEGKTIFKGLAEGGQTVMPFEKSFWGDVLGMLIDKFGIQWIINYREIQQ